MGYNLRCRNWAFSLDDHGSVQRSVRAHFASGRLSRCRTAGRSLSATAKRSSEHLYFWRNLASVAWLGLGLGVRVRG